MKDRIWTDIVEKINRTAQRCQDVKEPGLSWGQFCDVVLHRECLELPGTEPKCGKCLNGFGDVGSADCVAESRFCAEMSAPVGGTLAGVCAGAVPGQLCGFRCDPGHQLVGPATLLCGNDMNWDEKAPFCKATLKCSDIVDGTRDTWHTLCSRGKNMQCIEHPHDDPECTCKDGFKFNDLGSCVVASCDDVIVDDQGETLTWNAFCQRGKGTACVVDENKGPMCKPST